MTAAVLRYLAFVKLTGWTPPYVRMTTRLAATEFIEVGGRDGLYYVLKPGVAIDTELTRMGDVLNEVGYTGGEAHGRRKRYIRFTRPGEDSVDIVWKGRPLAYRDHHLIARTAGELRAAVGASHGS